MIRIAMLIALGVVTLVACDRSDGPSGPAPAAGEPYVLSTLDNVCDGSLTARDAFDLAMPEYVALLTYRDRPGTTNLRIRTHYEGGAITCAPHFDAPAGSRRPSGGPVVSIAVRIELLTEDGALDESMPATLTGGAGTQVTWTSGTLRPGDLAGTWQPDMPGYANVSFGFSGIFDGPTTSGAMIQGGILPGQVPSSGFAATW